MSPALSREERDAILARHDDRQHFEEGSFLRRTAAERSSDDVPALLDALYAAEKENGRLGKLAGVRWDDLVLAQKGAQRARTERDAARAEVAALRKAVGRVICAIDADNDAHVLPTLTLGAIRRDLAHILAADEGERSDRHPEHYCHRCGGPNFPWWVPSPVWNAVMGYPDQAHDGIVCPRCFAELAEAKGARGPWRVAPREWPDGVSLVHVDGRVWDAATELWVEGEAGT